MLRMPAAGLSVETKAAPAYNNFYTNTVLKEESLDNFFARPVRLATYSVQGAVTTGLPDFPAYTGTQSIFQYWRHMPSVSNKLEGYGLFKGRPKITLTLTGSPTATGTFQVSFFPLATQARTPSPVDVFYPPWVADPNFKFLRNQLPHFWVAVEEVRTYEMDLPYPLNTPAMDLLNNYGGDWFPFAETITEFRRNDGLTMDPLLIELYVSYHDVELSKPIVIQGATSIEGPWLSSRLQYASSVMSGVAGVFPFITPWAAITGALGSFAASMGFARPIQAAMEIHRVEVPGNISAHSGVPFFGPKIATDPAQATDVSGAFIPLTEKGDTSLAYVCARPGLVFSNAITPQAGQAPIVLNVQPHQASPVGTVLDGSGCKTLTPMGFCAMLFSLWSGDINVDLEFESNSLARCRYAIVLVPPGIAAPTAYTGTTSFQTTLVDVVGRTRVRVVSVYQSNEHWSRAGSANTTIGNPSTLFNRLAIFGLDNTGTMKIGLHVWLSAAENFRLAEPTNSRLAAFSLSVPTAPPPLARSDAVVRIDGCNQDPKLGMACFGSNIEDLVVLTRRPSMAFGYYAQHPVVRFEPFNCNPWGSGGTTQKYVTINSLEFDTVCVTVCEYVRSAYLGYSGGFRVTLESTSSTSNISKMGTHEFGVTGAGSNITTFYEDFVYRLAEDSRFTETEGRVDIARPFRCGLVHTPFTSTDVPVFAVYGIDAGNVYVSGADDFVFHGFMCAPPIYVYGP